MEKGYNPNDIAVPNGNYFAMPFSVDESRVVIISVPWDVTTSYRSGTSKGPDAIIEASAQIDYYNYYNPEGYKLGIGTLEIDYTIVETNRKLREEAEKVIIHLESGGSPDEPYPQKKLKRINEASAQLNSYVEQESQKWLNASKRVAIVGGDHSVPYGAIKAIARHEGEIGVLHLDAHCDLRNCYEGFQFSHASIMYNVLRDIPQVTKLVQIGVRDVCEQEVEFIASDQRIDCFSEHILNQKRFAGATWQTQCDEIIAKLPSKVYISFDIDALAPENCPNSGTPVPGGISFAEAIFLTNRVVSSGRTVVGFDLCEVAPGTSGDWDANVGARVLFALCGTMLY